MSTTKQEAEFTYYGVTKMSYDEQDKAQAAGKVAVSKSPVDISDSAVVAAREGMTFLHLCNSAAVIDFSTFFLSNTVSNREIDSGSRSQKSNQLVRRSLARSSRPVS